MTLLSGSAASLLRFQQQLVSHQMRYLSGKLQGLILRRGIRISLVDETFTQIQQPMSLVQFSLDSRGGVCKRASSLTGSCSLMVTKWPGNVFRTFNYVSAGSTSISNWLAVDQVCQSSPQVVSRILC